MWLYPNTVRDLRETPHASAHTLTVTARSRNIRPRNRCGNHQCSGVTRLSAAVRHGWHKPRGRVSPLIVIVASAHIAWLGSSTVDVTMYGQERRRNSRRRENGHATQDTVRYAVYVASATTGDQAVPARLAPASEALVVQALGFCRAGERAYGAAVWWRHCGLIVVHQALLWAYPAPGGARSCPGVRDPAPGSAARARIGVLVPGHVLGPPHGHPAVPVAVVARAPPRALSSPRRGHLCASPGPGPDPGGAQCPRPRTASLRQPQGDARQTDARVVTDRDKAR